MASTHMEASNKLFTPDWWRDYEEWQAQQWLAQRRLAQRRAQRLAQRLAQRRAQRRAYERAHSSHLTREAKKRRSTREAITRRSTLNQIEFGKQIRHAIHKEANKPLSTSLLAEMCKEILKTLLENNTVSRNTAQRRLLFYYAYYLFPPAQFKIFFDEYEWDPPIQSEKHKMHKALAERSYPPSPGAPFDDGNHAPASTRMPMKLPSNDPASVGASIDDVPNHIENPGHEPSSSTEASPAHAPDIISSSDGACDDGNRAPPSKQMAMAIASSDPASVGASIDDDPNHIENPGDEPSSSMEASAAHAPDITSSSNGACDDGNRAPPSKQMAIALPSDEPALVGASIDDPDHIDNPGDEPSSSTEASLAQVPYITSLLNGACDHGNHAPSSTKMPMALHGKEQASVGASIDYPNHIENPGDEPSSSTEASPAQVPDITPPLNGACDDGSHASPSTQMPMELPSNDPAPVGVSSDDDDPNDIENPRDGNGDLEDDDPNDIGNPRDGNRDLEDADPNDIENLRDGNRDLEDDDPKDENPHDGNGDLEAMHNHAIPKEVLLLFALQVLQTLYTVKSKDISLMSHKEEILQYCAEALIGTGFFCGLGVILLRNHRNLRAATKIMYRVGFYFTGLGFVATSCVSLGKFMFWILGFIGFLFSALYAYALWKGWIV